MSSIRPSRLCSLAALWIGLGAAGASLAEPAPTDVSGITIGVQGDGIVTVAQPVDAGTITLEGPADPGAVTVSTAADAEGAPVDFAAMQRSALYGSWRGRTGKYYVTSGYGYRRNPFSGQMRIHAGVDLAARMGTAILASSPGRVRYAGWAGGYGLLVEVEHAGGLQTRYGHLSRIAVSLGQALGKGDVIGFVGSTGSSTGPHLHYEVRSRGQAVDPLPRSRK